jgi:hypothetical protein
MYTAESSYAESVCQFVNERPIFREKNNFFGISVTIFTGFKISKLNI